MTVKNATRLNPEEREEQILNCAVDLAKTIGYRALIPTNVAKAANVSPSLVKHYFCGSAELSKLVLERSIRDQVVEVVAQGLAFKDPRVKCAPRELKIKAAKYLLT